MNIKSFKKLEQAINGSLNESTQSAKLPEYMLPLNESEKEQNSIERAMIVEENQFKLDSGYVMGDIKIPINNCFGLYWHKQNSTNVDEFVESVRNFLVGADVVLTNSDISRLKAAYGS